MIQNTSTANDIWTLKGPLMKKRNNEIGVLPLHLQFQGGRRDAALPALGRRRFLRAGRRPLRSRRRRPRRRRRWWRFVPERHQKLKFKKTKQTKLGFARPLSILIERPFGLRHLIQKKSYPVLLALINHLVSLDKKWGNTLLSIQHCSWNIPSCFGIARWLVSGKKRTKKKKKLGKTR